MVKALATKTNLYNQRFLQLQKLWLRCGATPNPYKQHLFFLHSFLSPFFLFIIIIIPYIVRFVKCFLKFFWHVPFPNFSIFGKIWKTAFKQTSITFFLLFQDVYPHFFFYPKDNKRYLLEEYYNGELPHKQIQILHWL